MDRRPRPRIRAAALAVALTSAAGGCRTSQTTTESGPSAGGGGVNAMLASKPGFALPKPGTPGAPPVQLAASRPPSKPGQGLKPETEVILGQADLEAAMMRESSADRDPLIDSARQHYAKAIKANPKLVGAYTGLARVYTFAGDRDNAMKTIQAGLAHVPADQELRFAVAKAAFVLGDFAASEAACKNVLAGDPQNRQALKTMAICQAHQNRYDEAFATLVTTNTMPQSEARYFLGKVLVDVGRIDEGRAQFAEAQKLDPSNQLAIQAMGDLDKPPEPVDPRMGVVRVEARQ